MSQPPENLLALHGYSRSRHQLAFTFTFGELRFSTSYWWEDVDLPALEAAWGRPLLEKIYAHLAAFEINKLASLRPATVSLGPLGHHVTPELTELWCTVFHHVWAQWRYENDLPHEEPPELLAPSSAAGLPPPAAKLTPGAVETLSFCGGGKDSLVAARLLDEIGEPHDSLGYSSSIYGTAAHQHQLIDRLCAHTGARRHRRQWIFEDVLDSPVLALHPELGVRTLAAAETPASLFAALPLVLQHGYRYLVLAHERSADYGNLVWEATGEKVNHQWGKSWAAEKRLAAYIREHLIEGCEYFSLLKPLHDALIFYLLRRWPEALAATHSCNLAKPWCRRCAKCAYVWLNYRAWLPEPPVAAIFGENLFEPPENQLFFRQLLGLEAHTPFECVGRVEESRLAFELCRRRGAEGRAMEMYEGVRREEDWLALARRLLTVEESVGRVPERFADPLWPLLQQRSAEARAWVGELLD